MRRIYTLRLRSARASDLQTRAGGHFIPNCTYIQGLQRERTDGNVHRTHTMNRHNDPISHIYILHARKHARAHIHIFSFSFIFSFFPSFLLSSLSLRIAICTRTLTYILHTAAGLWRCTYVHICMYVHKYMSTSQPASERAVQNWACDVYTWECLLCRYLHA